MSGHSEYFVDAGGRNCRIWTKGEGRPIYWLASAPLLLKWTAIHEALSAQGRLVVCALPGMAGNGRNHEDLDDHLSWVLAAHDVLVAAGLKQGDTLMGSSTAAALAADVAAVWPDLVGRLILVAPHGLFDESEPTADMYALHPRDAAARLSHNPAVYKAHIAAPQGVEPVLWSIEVSRSNEASARFLWPLGDTRLKRRLHRISAPTMLVWGEQDRIVPPSYAQRFATLISAPVSFATIADAGHTAELDQPDEVARAVHGFAATG